MSINLHLGVIDLPYQTNRQTTGEIAQYLENKYNIMEGFYQLYQDEIAKALAHSMAGSLNSILNGANASTHDPFGSATSLIDVKFKQFISNEEITKFAGNIQYRTAGGSTIPTKAALEGRSSRFKIGKNWKWIKKGKKSIGVRRPSFIDTGLYQASFKSWIKVS